MLTNPKTIPTRGKKSNIEARTSLCDKSVESLNEMGKMEKYEKENFSPR